MTSAHPTRDPLRNLFRDIVLVLGGVFAARETDSETIWRVARGLECAYRRARTHGNAGELSTGSLAPHPAITTLLDLTRSEETDTEARSGAAAAAPQESGFLRAPGLFRRWEVEQVVEAGTDFHLEEAGTASDGTQLFAIYRREHQPDEEE